MKNTEVKYKYWNHIGYWINEDNGCDSFIFNTKSPYFKSFIRYHFNINKNYISVMIFCYKPNGTRYTIKVENGEYVFSPLETLEEKLGNFLHGYNFPKLYKRFGVKPKLTTDFLSKINNL